MFLSQQLASVSSLADIAQTAVNHILAAFNSPAALFLPDDAGEHLLLQAGTADFELENDGYAVADWVFRHGQPAGRHTDTLTGVEGYYLPLQTSGQIIGVMAVKFPDEHKRSFAGKQRYLLTSFASQIALALERAYLAEQAAESYAPAT